MEDYFEQIQMLRWKSNDAEKVKSCEKLIKEAQRLQDEEMEYRARCVYLEAITFNHEPEKMLACFPWLLNVHDKNPGKYDTDDLLWYYKWVINHVTKFPSITKERVFEILNDMETRYITAGHGIKTVLNYKRCIYQDFGEPEAAELANEEWLNSADDSMMANCKACIMDQIVEYKLWKGDYEGAITDAADLISRKYVCGEVPDITFSKVLYSYSCLDRFEEGIDIYRQLKTKFNDEKAYLTDYASILIYLSLTQNFVPAKNAFIKQMPYALTNKCAYYVYEFYLGVLIFLKTLKSSGKEEIVIPKNIELPIAHNEFTYKVEDVLAFIDEQTDLIADNFNQRNGNTFYSEEKKRTLGLLSLSRKVDLKLND